MNADTRESRFEGRESVVGGWGSTPLHVIILFIALVVCPKLAIAQPRLTKPPRLVQFVEAIYPEDRIAEGLVATVELSIHIGADGHVVSVDVVNSAGPDFDAAAVTAAEQFVFEPAEIDERPAPIRIHYRYAFAPPTLESPPPSSPPSTPTPTSPPPSRQENPQTQRRTVTEPPSPTVVDEERVVRAPRIHAEPTEEIVRVEEARRIPGTQGDALKVVHNLPGVARSAPGSGQLVVWGSAPRDTRVYLDGVELPALYHLGGYRATVNAELVDSIRFVPGAYGAEYGRGLGGVVRLETRSTFRDGLHGYVAADVLDASGMLSGNVTPRIQYTVAGRTSYVDRLLAGVVNKDIQEFMPLPSYRDAQGRMTIRLSGTETLSATLLGSQDQLRRTSQSGDPSDFRSDSVQSDFYRAYARYENSSADGSNASVTPFVGYDLYRQQNRFGETPTELRSSGFRYGVRASYRTRPSEQLRAGVGMDAWGANTAVSRFGTISLPAREGDITVFGQQPADELSSDTWNTDVLNVAPHASVDWTVGRFTVTPGFRFDIYALASSRVTPRAGTTPAIGYSHLLAAPAPRLSIQYRPTSTWTWMLSTGVYHQPPDPEDLSAVFGNPRLGLSRAVHAAVGSSIRLTSSLEVELTTFFKHFDDLAMRSTDPSPKLAETLEPNGTGRSYGAQVMIRQRLWAGLSGWIAYSLSRSERSRQNEQDSRLFDYDQTHVLSAVASYTVCSWTFGGRFRWATGYPRTPVIGSYFNATDDRFEPVFGAQNSTRIPDFVQLDVRAERTFVLSSHVNLDVYVEVLNVLNINNSEEIAYSRDYRSRSDVAGLPILALLGGRLSF